MNKTLIILCGPTGVGKTDVSLALAQKMPLEIINGDMGQCYTPLTVGTAKPQWRQDPVPHHLFDIITDPIDYSVMSYHSAVRDACRHIEQRHHIPLVVGGSGFYIRSLLFPLSIHTRPLSTPDPWQDIKTTQLWQDLFNVDADRARCIHPHDRYRISRALHIWHQTGKKPSDIPCVFHMPAKKVVIIWISRERNELYARINQRVDQMINNGWIEETERLLNTPWKPFLLSKKIIGYDDIIRYLHHKQGNLPQLQEIIAQKTRQYAKRQITYWNMLNRTLHDQLQNIRAQQNTLLIHEVVLTDHTTTTCIDALAHTLKKVLQL